MTSTMQYTKRLMSGSISGMTSRLYRVRSRSSYRAGLISLDVLLLHITQSKFPQSSPWSWVESPKRICQSIYLNLGKNEFLERQVRDQTYCQGCSKYVALRFTWLVKAEFVPGSLPIDM